MRRNLLDSKSHLGKGSHAPHKRGAGLGFWETRFQPGEKPGEPWKPISYISPRFKQFLGYNQEDPLTYDDWKSLIHPDDVANVFRAIDEHTRHKRPYDLEYSMRTTSGEYRRFHVHGQAVWDECGNKIRMAGWLADVSGKRRADSALQQRGQNISALAQMARVGVFHADAKGQFVYMNNILREIAGVAERDRLPSRWHDLVHEEDVRRLVQSWDSAVRRRTAFHHEFRIRDKGGAIRSVIVQAEPEVDGHGQILFYIGTMTDVTAIGQREQDLREQVTALEDKVTEFLGEIERANDTLNRQAVELQDANTALNVLINRRSQEEAMAEERMLMNLKEMVLPFLEKLRYSCRRESEHTLLETIEHNLYDITSPLLSRLTSGFIGLTQQELRVAKLIRDGKLTKEIASLLNISENVVKTHRAHIRQKLHLSRKKLNLKEFLMKLADK